MADDLTVAVVTSEERRRAYATVAPKVRDAARAGDAGAAFLLERFFTETKIAALVKKAARD
jgi:N-acetylglucosamine kinase-like BadF-type ATPase